MATLIDAMSASDFAEMEISKDGWTLRLRARPKGRRVHQPDLPGQ